MKNYANDAQLYNAYNCGDRYMYCGKNVKRRNTVRTAEDTITSSVHNIIAIPAVF